MLTTAHSANAYPITEFTFLPDTFRFGADPQITVITAYLDVTPELLNSVLHRRTKLQTGEPVALIVAYDLEYASLQMYCISCNNTQCQIRLHHTELITLHQSLTESIQTLFHNTPENLLNIKRERMHLPKLDASVPQTTPSSSLES